MNHQVLLYNNALSAQITSLVSLFPLNAMFSGTNLMCNNDAFD